MRRARFLVVCCIVASCKTPTDCETATYPSVVGPWTYTATQNAPTTANLTGTLVIGTQCGTTLTGTLDVTETDAQGSRRRTGTLSGRTVDSVTLDFDVFLTTTGRRHVGALAGDSLKGTWIEPLDLGNASGSFDAVRAP